MRGMRVRGRGMDWSVRGTKGASSCASVAVVSEGRAWAESDGCVVVNVDCGAGAVMGRTEGLGSGGSRDVVRRGRLASTASSFAGEEIVFSCCLSSCSFC